jgi:hypothetical protein
MLPTQPKRRRVGRSTPSYLLKSRCAGAGQCHSMRVGMHSQHLQELYPCICSIPASLWYQSERAALQGAGRNAITRTDPASPSKRKLERQSMATEWLLPADMFLRRTDPAASINQPSWNFQLMACWLCGSRLIQCTISIIITIHACLKMHINQIVSRHAVHME